MDFGNDEKILDLLERLVVDDHIVEDEISSAVGKVTQAGHVPCSAKAEDVPYDKSDFEGIASNAESQLCIISRLLKAVYNAQSKGQQFSTIFLRNVIVDCLLVASEYSENDWEWSSSGAAAASKTVFERLCDLANCDSLRGLLNDIPVEGNLTKCRNLNTDAERPNYLEITLQKLTKTLNKKTWKAYPASKASYWLILMQLEQKKLGDCLAYILPPALFIVDDWEQKNKVFGLKSLHHILKNTTGSEIRWYGRAVVIYDAIKPLLHSREEEVLGLLYPTITLAAEVLEADPTNTGQLRSMTSFDIIMQQLILEMRYEQKLALRSLYSAALPTILNAMGILAVRWSRELIPMCEDYLATPSGPASKDRINILQSLQAYIRLCWPQIHVHASSILKMILRLIYDVTDEDSGLESEVVTAVTKESLEVINLLHAAAPRTTQEVFRGVTSIEVHPQCQEFLTEIEIIVSSKAEILNAT